INKIKHLVYPLNITTTFHLQMQGSKNPVISHRNDLSIANRIAETIVATFSVGGADVFLDTFVDHDRGYYIRNGVVDRRYNPRMTYQVLRNLQSVLVRQQGHFKIIRLEKTMDFRDF